MTYTSEDFERFYLRYKAEAMPRGTSIQAYYSRNKVPYNLFDKWYKDTRHRLVSVQVDGIPKQSDPEDESKRTGNNLIQDTQANGVRIMIDLRMTNGMHVQHRNLSYESLKRLICTKS